jgi:DNA-binding response OmpR family regulator
VRQNILLVEDQAVIAMDIADVLAEIGIDVGASAYSVEEARDYLWRQPFDAALLELKVRGEPTFGLADWLTAWNVPTVFLTDRHRGELPERHRDRPRVHKPLDPRELAFKVARATGVLAPVAPLRRLSAGLPRWKELDAAERRVLEAENRVARLRLLVRRYPTPEGQGLLPLLETSLGAMTRTRDLLRGTPRAGRD